MTTVTVVTPTEGLRVRVLTTVSTLTTVDGVQVEDVLIMVKGGRSVIRDGLRVRVFGGPSVSIVIG